MRICRDYARAPAGARGAVVAVGNFDGVHLGHRGVIGRAAELAREHGAPLGVLAFEPHPADVLRPECAPQRLTPFRARVRRLRECGADYFFCQRFTRAFAAMSPDDFVSDVLVSGLGVRRVVAGHDYRYGHRRAGDAASLSAAGAAQGFGVTVVGAIGNAGEVYSSTRARQYLKRGEPRLDRMPGLLEDDFQPSIVLIESRSGLQDIGAATVTDIDARALLFATDSEAGWADYGVLFRYWRERGLADSIRERLAFVSALTPTKNRAAYLDRFRERTRELFRERLSEAPDSSPESNGGISSGGQDGDGAHDPMPILWNEDLAAATSLCAADEAAVELAYGPFFDRFASLAGAREEGLARADTGGASEERLTGAKLRTRR